MNYDAQDKEAIYLSLFNPKSDDDSSLFDAFGFNKQGEKTKSFGTAIGTDESMNIDVYQILSETFKWFPPKPLPDEK